MSVVRRPIVIVSTPIVSLIDTITIGLRTTEESCPSDFSKAVITLSNFSHHLTHTAITLISHVPAVLDYPSTTRGGFLLTQCDNTTLLVHGMLCYRTTSVVSEDCLVVDYMAAFILPLTFVL